MALDTATVYARPRHRYGHVGLLGAANLAGLIFKIASLDVF